MTSRIGLWIRATLITSACLASGATFAAEAGDHEKVGCNPGTPLRSLSQTTGFPDRSP